MRFFIVASAILVVFAQCGYPTADYYATSPSYPLPKKYPVAQKPFFAAPPPPPAPSSLTFSDTDIVEDSEDNSATDYRRRAKARTAHNRHFRRRALQPIRRFQQRKH